MAADEHTEELWLQRSDLGESNAWYQRFSEYLALGAGRSIRAVYNAEKGNERSKPVPSSWTAAAKRFEWRRRAEAYDAHRRAVVFSTGNAADTARVQKLDALIEKMYARLVAGLDAMEVNDRFIERFIAVMDLMARHTSGYAPTRHEVTGKSGEAIKVEEEATTKVVFYMPEIPSLEDVDSNEALLEPARLEEGEDEH